MLHIDVLNAGEIRVAYGDAAWQEAATALLSLLRSGQDWLRRSSGGLDHFETAGACHVGGSSFHLIIAAPEAFPIEVFASRVLRELALSPIEIGLSVVHLALDIRIWRPADHIVPAESPAGTPLIDGFRKEPLADIGRWRADYQRDMAIAADVLMQLSNHRLALALQPITTLGKNSPALYDECLLRGILPEGRLVSMAPAIAALERLGLVRVLDQAIAKMAIDRLRSDPERRLGVNVSAQSAILDGWWVEFLEELTSNPQLAERLVVEITETTEFPAMEAMRGFVNCLSETGCMIALDDFGARREPLISLFGLPLDFIKVDAAVMAETRRSPERHSLLEVVVRLAANLGRYVIVEGIETSTDSALALASGATGQQGYYIERPHVDHLS